MEKFLKISAVLLILICLLLSSSATQARAVSEGGGTINAQGVNLRSEPTTASGIITVLYEGDEVVVTDKSTSGWYKVNYDGNTGYVSSEFVSLASSAQGDFGRGTVTGDTVRIRSGPGTSYDILDYVDTGDTLSVTGVSDDWYKVSINGNTGYIRSDYLSLDGGSGTTSASATDAQGGSAVVSSASGTGTINGTYVRFRSGPSTSSDILGSFDYGDTVTVIGDAGDWYKVTYAGEEGYVYKIYLNVNGSSAGSTGTSTDNNGVSSMDETTAWAISAVHMRTGPDTSYTSLRVLDQGESVTLIGSTDEWYKVRYNGEEGYVFKTYLSANDPVSSPVSSSSEGERIVSEAKNYLGTPYVYGGSSPSGFDCSGFVQYVFRQCGYSITRTAVTQSYDGYSVSTSSLQPGDILIFGNGSNTGIGHSGIYIGGGQFIHASSGGGRVMISELSQAYYAARLYDARRIVG